jgi:YVTN family beta-propeller protein
MLGRQTGPAALPLALIVALGGVAWRALPGGPQPAATGLPRQVEAAIRVGKAPCAVAVLGPSVWVANCGDGTVSCIDRANNQVIATIKVDERRTHMTANAGAVWVTTPVSMQYIDPTINSAATSLPLPAGPGDVALAFDGALWVSRSGGTVRKLDPSDGREVASVSVASGGLSRLAIGEDTVGSQSRHAGCHQLLAPPEEHPVCSPVGREPGPRGDRPCCGQTADLGCWLRWNRRPVPGRPVPAGASRPAGLTGGPLRDRRWTARVALASRSTQTVMWVDPATGQAKARIRLPGVSDVAVGTTAVWASAGSRNLLYRIDPDATG